MLTLGTSAHARTNLAEYKILRQNIRDAARSASDDAYDDIVGMATGTSKALERFGTGWFAVLLVYLHMPGWVMVLVVKARLFFRSIFFIPRNLVRSALRMEIKPFCSLNTCASPWSGASS